MIAWFIALFLILTAAYSNHFHNGFQFDDSHAIQYNPAIRSLANIPRMFTDSSTFSILRSGQSYRPVVSASLAIDYALAGGLKPFWFHLSTFFWLCVLVACLYALAFRVFESVSPNGPRNPQLAWLAAGLFGLHPAGAETVNYIIQRGDLYVVLAIAGGVALYAWAPDQRRFGLYLVAPFLGMLAKPPALIFPLMLLAYILLFDRSDRTAPTPAVPKHRGNRRAPQPAPPASKEPWTACVRRAIPAFLLTAFCVLLEKAMTSAHFFATRGSAFDYVITQPHVALRYFRSFFWPLYLSADTDLKPFESPWNAPAAAGILFLALLVAAAIGTARKQEWRPVSFGLWWFFIGLLPTSVYPLAEVENDHRMYLPFAGLAIAVVWSAALLFRRLPSNPAARLAAWIVPAVVLGLFAWGAHQRNEVWRTDETLWRDVITKSPNNARGLLGYGNAQLAKGDVQTAYDYYVRAASINPNDSNVEVNLGVASGALCRDPEAETHFDRAQTLAPHDAFSYIGRAQWLLWRKDSGAAIATFQQAFKQQAFFLLSSYGLMNTLAARAEWQNLRSVAADVLQTTPGDPLAASYQFLADHPDTAVAQAEARAKDSSAQQLLNESVAYEHAGRHEDALRAAQKILDLEPGSPWARLQINAARLAMARRACQPSS